MVLICLRERNCRGSFSALQPENWRNADTFINTWEAPTYLIASDSSSNLRGEGNAAMDTVQAACKAALEEWTGKRLFPTSIYGIRVYKDKAVLSTRESSIDADIQLSLLID
jgi:hypothetical protein